MRSRGFTVTMVRWLALVLTPFLVALVAQIVVSAAVARSLFWILGADLLNAFSRNVFSIPWAVKGVSALFMGAAFVAAARRMAPARKNVVVSVALGVVVLWGSFLITGAFNGGRFFPWLFVMGLMGWFGGILAYWLSRGSRGSESSNFTTDGAGHPRRGGDESKQMHAFTGRLHSGSELFASVSRGARTGSPPASAARPVVRGRAS